MAFLIFTGGVAHAARAGAPSWDMSTPVYYNPNGGKFYHGDQHCGSVSKRYLPLSQLTLADLYIAPYDALTPCSYCSPPHKPSAECAILYDLSSGRILYEKNAAQHSEPASLTKLLTVLTAYANGGESISYTVGSEIKMIGRNSSIAYLRKGDVLSFQAVVDAMLLASGNDAAYTLAVNVARFYKGKQLSNEEALTVFQKLMNETAEALGLTDSHFVSVDGYPSEGHYTTAYDMLKIAIAAAGTQITAESVAKSSARHVFQSGRDVVWKTTNQLLKTGSKHYYECATGMKTGTGKGYSLAASAEKDGMRLIAIVLNAASDEDRFQETISLLEYGFEMGQGHNALAGF